jgi:nucleoside-diphosphate-sugar epimerase
MERVLVTGANGFVGRVLCETLQQRGFEVRAAVRRSDSGASLSTPAVVVGEVGARTDWSRALQGVTYVIHAAARAHVLHDNPANSLLYHQINELGTRALADSAVRARVRRLVFLSSVKVNGEQTYERPFRASDAPDPQDPYAVSKLRAEQYLQELSRQARLETVVVRPPLVYGPHVRANFLRLLRWVDQRRPLPFARIDNRRSLVSIWNLCDLVACTLVHPRASGRTWLVSDGQDLSTPELVRQIAVSMDRQVRLLPVPVMVLRGVARALGRGAEFNRLCGSLAVDIADTRGELGWSPPLDVADSLRRTVAWYFNQVVPRGT